MLNSTKNAFARVISPLRSPMRSVLGKKNLM
jgi:hypothetical protein